METVLDVGANRGQTVSEFRSSFPDARIVAIEPDPRMVSILKKKSYLQNFEVVQAGVGPTDEPVTFYVSKEFPHINSMIEFDGAETITVKQMTLDKIVSQLDIEQVDVLKIDAEGYDAEVIKSGSALFASGKVSAVSVEVGVNKAASGVSDFFQNHNLMQSFGYQIVGFYDPDYTSILSKGIFKNANVIYVSPNFQEGLV